MCMKPLLELAGHLKVGEFLREVIDGSFYRFVLILSMVAFILEVYWLCKFSAILSWQEKTLILVALAVFTSLVLFWTSREPTRKIANHAHVVLHKEIFETLRDCRAEDAKEWTKTPAQLDLRAKVARPGFVTLARSIITGRYLLRKR